MKRTDFRVQALAEGLAVTVKDRFHLVLPYEMALEVAKAILHKKERATAPVRASGASKQSLAMKKAWRARKAREKVAKGRRKNNGEKRKGGNGNGRPSP